MRVYIHCEIRKDMGNVLEKIVKKPFFSKMKLNVLLMKKRTLFPSKICLEL